MTLRRLFMGAAFLLLPWSVDAGGKLSMNVSPTVCFAPANLMVRAYVTTDPDNRAIEVVAESPDFYRSSEIQLDGDRAPRTTVFEFRALPTGTYVVTAVLLGTRGRRAEVRSEVNVMEAGGGER